MCLLETRKLQCRARDQALDSFGGCRRRPFERGQLARFAKRIQLVVTARLRVRHQCRAVSSSRCCAGRLPLRLGSRARRKGLCRRRALCVLGTGDRGLLCGAKSAERACGGGGAATNSFDSVHSSTGPSCSTSVPGGRKFWGALFRFTTSHFSSRRHQNFGSLTEGSCALGHALALALGLGLGHGRCNPGGHGGTHRRARRPLRGIVGAARPPTVRGGTRQWDS